jgi:hypothetical protein
MITSRTPDPDRSCALLIGASVYDSASQYESVSSAAESAIELGRLLATPDMWGLPPGQVEVLSGRITTRQAATAIEAVAGRPGLDGLFIYICAHGRAFTDHHVPDKDLHFAFADSDRDWSYTHLPFLTVQRMLTRRNEAPATLLVIDSCNAGGAFLGPSSALIRPASRGDHTANVATIVATSGHEQVPAIWPGSRCTPFASMLIEVVKNGITDMATEFLTPDDVREEIRRKLRQAGLAMIPDSRTRGSLFVCRNHAYQHVATSDTTAHLMTWLDDPKTIATSVYAAALETQHATHPDRAAELVIAFGSRRTGDETFKLAKALRSHSVAELNGYAEKLIGRVYACRPAPEIVAMLHQHAEDPAGLDIDAVLKLMAEQPDQVAADVCAEMREMSCPDCNAVGRRIDDQMMSAWPPDRKIGLLSALH